MSPDRIPEKQTGKESGTRTTKRDSTYNPLTRLAPLLYGPEELSRQAMDELWERVHAEARKKP